ncbi:hypothetical protein [Aquimarina sediminis]|uniref:hypothetical protein n=1 Tax=Aquimarina sediminis TaxID=2070536 RepID=UPI000CA05634|nr:hypothetical protein [Aquimarina sediminis]
METITEIKQSKKTTSLPIIAGGVFIIIGLISITLRDNGMYIGIGIFSLVGGLLNKNLKILKLYPQYLQVQLSVVRPKNLIKYEQITSFSIVSKNIIILYKTDSNEPKAIKIRIKALEKEDLLKLNKVLQEKTKLGDINTLNATSQIL